MESSEDQHSVSEHGVAGRVCPSSQEYKKPPQLSFKLKKAGDVPKSTETWNDDHLPIDILLLTVESCGFLSCFSFLDQPFKSYKFGIGYVYFGHMGDASDQEKLKVALMTCSKGSATPGSSLTVLLNALRVLRPKAVFSVGTCISLSLENVRMGDVVISSKLTTAEGYRSSACRLFVSLVQDAPCGWVAPLANPDELKVKVHCNGDILIQSLEKKCQYDDIYEKYPGAVAIETDGRGVNASAFDANIKWVAVKGVASYFLQSHSATAEWMCFASTMAASVVAKMLNDPTVFREWPHYNQADDANTEWVEGKQVASYSDPSQSATSKRMSFTTTVAASLGAKMINAQTFFWKWQQLNQGVYAAAYDANIEWVIVKGVASYFHERKSVRHEWMSFASTMAASVVDKMLNDPTVVQEWRHYNQVAGGKKKELCLPSPEYEKPPQHSFKLKKGGGVPKSTETWGNDHLRIDILLLAVESSDFVSCLSFLDKRFKSYKMGIGYLYFGCMGDATDPEKLKIALMYFPKVAALTAGSSLAVVLNAVRVLRPKAAFSGGTCISLDLKKFRMGDVVISLKLTAEGFRTPVGPFLGSLIQDAPHGWVAPLENLDEFQVKVHWDGKILSLSLREKGPCDDICKQYPGAVVIETEGVDAATHDANIDWVAVKGVASYFCRSQSATSGWMSFASTMDAAVVTKMLNDPTVFREWPHNNQVTPLEIYWRGPRALEAYYKALDEGQMRVRRIPLMLIGQARSGKTSLKKSLKGVPFNPNEDSTVQIDADPSYFKVTTETWKIGEKDQDTNKEATSYFEFNLARQMLKWIKHDVNLPKTGTEAQSVSVRNEVTRDPTDITSRIFDQEASSLHSPARTHSKAGKDDNHAFQSMCKYKSCPEQTIERDDPLSLQETFKEIESSLSDLLAVDELESEDDIYSVLWDFSGESVYYETHSLFLTSRAIYLLAYDLSLDPYERAQAVKRQEMFRVSEDRIGTKTNLDYLDYWMTSVSSVSSSGGKDHDVLPASESTVLPKRIPPVFLVCTNADRPFGGKDPKDLALKVYDELLKKPYNTHLWGQYEVDNNKSNQKRECLGVSRLREKIREVAKELPQMKEFIPIKWLKFEKILDVFLCKGHKWITIERAKQIANDLCQIHDDEEFKTALGFLHDQRILFHLENAENLSQFVFLDPQWLIDVMKKVITIKRYDDGEKEFLGLWRKLQEEGILEEKLLKHVWGPLIGEDAVFESLIKIMEKFSLLCTWPASDDLSGRKYLVPSILTTYPPQDITKLISSARVPSLFIKFESGQVPSRLFPRLVTQFLLWGKDGFWSSENPPLYQNLARLYTAKDDKCSVVLLCHSSFIEVVVHGDNDSFKVSCAQSVLGQLLFILKRMRTELFWLKGMRYQAGVVCTVCCCGRKVKFCHKHRRNDCEREECLHFIPESELRSADESITCTRSPTLVYNKICIEDFSLWFGSCQKDSSFSSASVPHLQKSPKGCSMSTFSRKLKVTLLASEWGSSKGGLSTITRELAIQLARNDYVEVCMYLPLFSDKDKEAAADLRVCLLKAKEKHGYDDPIDWLISIPRNQQMDIVIGHGIHLGRQVPHLKEPHPECKWIQVVHTDPKELGMLKTDADPTATGTKKHEAEVKLCQEADQVVAIGPKLADTYSHFCGTGKVLVLTPGIFSEFTDINQDTQERTVFHVLVFGCGESEDFHLKGYDIAARAVAELKDEEPLFKLVFVGAPSGKEEQIKQMLLKEGILAPQLIVRSAKEREQLALQFHEADLVIMPSRSNDFGLAALEALSAGLPVLVSRTSGLGEALKEVPYGKNFVLNSEDPTEWAKEIKAIKSERREVRLKKAIRLREKYAMKYQWEKQCRRLVQRMREIVKS